MPAVFACVTPHPPVIVPAVGRGRERDVQDTLDAFAQLRARLAEAEPDVLLFICPHGVVTRDRFHVLRGRLVGNLERFGAREVAFDRAADGPLIDAILQEAEARGIRLDAVEEWEANDHSAWVPLHYLEPAAPSSTVVMLSISFGSAEDHYALGRVVAEVMAGSAKRVAIIASADGAHTLREDGPYGFHPASIEFEERFHTAFERWDLEQMLGFDETFRMQAGEDSIPSVAFLMGALSYHDVTTRILASEGPWGVGYMTGLVEVGRVRGYGEPQATMSVTPAEVRIARAAVEAYVQEGKRLADVPFAEERLRSRAGGAFVTIVDGAGALRGCIGTTIPTEARLLDEIVANAIGAASRDPRFSPVKAEELPGLRYKVDLLSTPERIADRNELDAARFGVVVESGEKRGLLLPDLAGIETVAEQIRVACEKAEIGEGEPLTLWRFEVRRFQEPES